MANNPYDSTPEPTRPDDRPERPHSAVPGEDATLGSPFASDPAELPPPDPAELSPLDLAELADEATRAAPEPLVTPEADAPPPTAAQTEAQPPPPTEADIASADIVSVDDPFAIPEAEPASFTQGLAFAEPGEFGSASEADAAGREPPAEPTPEPVADLADALPAEPTPEPQPTAPEVIVPVMPASDWLDADDFPTPAATPLDSALFPEAAAGSPDAPDTTPPAAVDSSDIFGGLGTGPVPVAELAEAAGPPDAGGSAPSAPDGSELPLAEDALPEADEDFFQALQPAPDDPERLFDASELERSPLPEVPDEPDLPDDQPDYGATPLLTPDASSILADLTEPVGSDADDSSAVRLELPGMERTHSSHLDEATEFDLALDDLSVVPPELEAAAAGDEEPVAWQEQLGSDLFAEAPPAGDDAASADVLAGLEDNVVPVDPTFEADDPSLASAASSLLSNRPPAPAGSGPFGSDPSDSEAPIGFVPPVDDSPVDDSEDAVEFSDHPEAESEAAASRSFGVRSPGPTPGPTLAADQPAGEDQAATGWPADAVGAADVDAPFADAPFAGTDDQPDAFPLPTGSEAAAVEPDWLAGAVTDEPARADGDTTERVEIVPTVLPTRPAPHESATPSPASRQPARTTEADKTSPTARKPGPGPARDRSTPERMTPERHPAERPARAGRGGWLGGLLLGLALGGGAFAGAYFGGLLPQEQAVVQKPKGSGVGPDLGSPGPTPGGPATGTPGPATGSDTGGDNGTGTAGGDNPVARAAAGAAELFALIRESARNDQPITADNPRLATVREKLAALANAPEATADPDIEKAAVTAAVRLAVTHELTGDLATARRIYQQAREKFPRHAAVFEASLERLDATTPAAAPERPEGTSRRLPLHDARQLLLAVVLLQADPPADAEAGTFFWKAVNHAAAGRYAEALPLLEQARAAHLKQARAAAGTGLNPLSDPLEQIFPRCCDELKAYWQLRAAIYSNKAVADAFRAGPAKAVETLATALDRAAEAATLRDELRTATAKLDKAATDLKKAETDLDNAKKQVASLQKDLKTATDDKTAVEKKLLAEEKARQEAEAARIKADDLLTRLARELQAAKLLGETFDPGTLLAAQKQAVERATGPNLSTLVPPGMMAVGSGLSGAQLLDIAQRLSRAEAAARAAADTLAAELKKLTDAHTAELKKLTDTHAADLAKLKADQSAELKKANDAYAAEAKKLTVAFEGKLKELEARLAKEKAEAEAAADRFRRELAGAITPAQVLDLWLPLLVELRRPADSDAALAAAQKVLAAAAPDSEEAAKARTVAGLALLFRNELPTAKAMFEAARTNPNYPAAAQARKLWAVAVETGLESVADPLAPYRQKPELPKRDPVLATRYLDAGVKAYRAGRYAEAVAALTESTKADPTSPLAWYFLGAARWATGDRDAARDDFRQGALREQQSDTPSHVLNSALSPIQGAARDALDLSRP